MNRKWMRILSALMCLALLLSSVPVGAEEYIENIVEEGSADVPAIEAPVAELESEPTLEDAPVEEATEEIVEAVPSEEPDEEIPTEAPVEEVPEELTAALPSLDELVSQWIEALNAQSFNDDYRKAFWLYDRLIANFERGSADDPQTALMTYSASPLGYAYAYAALAQAAGIECVAIVAENTAWNAAKIDGEWTHIDAWMDDAEDSFGLHFGLTDAAMARDHAWEASTSPVCAGTHNNYFVRERGYQAFASEDELRALLISAKESQATELYLYNAGERPVIGEAIGALLAEMETVAAETYEQGCYAAVQLRHIEPEPTPDPDGIFSVFVPDVPEIPDESDEPGAPDTMGSTGETSATAKPATAQSIVPKASSLTLGVGETASVAGWTMLPAGVQEKVTYTSKGKNIATVNADGKVTAKKAGSTTITISAASGVSCSVSVTVKKAPTSVKISAPRTELGVGETMQLGYTLSSGSAGKVTFSVPANQKVASVTSDGLITALKAGKVTVTVKTYNGYKKTGTLTVKAAPTSVKFSVKSVTLGVGETYAPAVTLSSGAASALSYATSKSAVAAVDPNTGMIAAAGTGEANITVTTHNGLSAALKVTVVAAPKSLKLSAARTEIGLKETIQLTPEFPDYKGDINTVTYSSNKTSVATVNAAGVVTAKKAGTATITATSYNGLKATLNFTVKKAPTSVKIAAPRTELGVGETMQLGYTLSSGSAGKVTFSVPANQKVASVTSDGLITALKAGKVTVTVKTYNGYKKTGTLTVKAAPTSVTLSAKSVTLGAGDTYTPTVKLNSGAVGQVTFSSSNTSVAKVDSITGMITAVAAGDAVITARTYNDKTATLKVTVVAAPKSMKLTAPRTEIGVKETVQLTPTFTSFKGDSCTATYATSNKNVATVSAAGVVTAKKAGTATITATSYNGLKATLKFTVKKAPSSVKITYDRAELGVGETMQLGYTLSSGSAGGATFSVPANQQVATITPDGEITALKTGKVTVTVKTYNGYKKTGTLTVKAAPTSVTLSAKSVTLGAGDTYTPTVKLNSGAVGQVSFSSSNTSVAKADSTTGTITAVAAGDAVITAKTYNGKTATLNVKVVAAPKSMKLSASSASMGVKETMQLTPTFTDFKGDNCTVTYTTSSKTVATVSAAGLITAKKAGTATITATSYNGLKATLKITVKKAPTSVKITYDRAELGVGETMQLGYTLSSGSAGKVTFSVPANQQVATITPDGEITALKTGKVTVTAKTYNGYKKTGTLTVKAAPTSVEFSVESVTLGVKDSYTSTVALNSGAVGQVTFSSSNTSVADVDSITGKITTVATGEAVITARTYNDKTAKLNVTVLPAPKSVSLASKTVNLGVGDTYQIQPKLNSGAGSSFTYESSNKTYATVNADGVVTAKKVGKSTITIKTYNGLSTKLTINVKKQPSSIKADPATVTLGVGETAALGATLPSDTATTLSYKTADKKIATVSSKGVVTGVAVGDTKITLTSTNGKTTTCTVHVVKAPTAIKVAMPTTLGLQQVVTPTITLTPKGSSSTPVYSVVSGSAVEIDADGNIVAVSKGTATIRVSTHVEDVYAECKVTVKAAPTSVSFDKAEYSVNMGSTLQLAPTLPSGAATEFTYTIKKTGFFTIDENGLVEPIKRGSSEVTVTTHNGKTASTTVWVVDPDYPEKISLSNTPPTSLGEGKTFTPKLDVFPKTASASMKWTSSVPSVASVNSSTGKVTALCYGTTTIKGVSTKNSALTVTYNLYVTSDTRCLVMPEHRTDTSKINATLQQIKNVRASAYQELDELVSKGWITSSERTTRKGYIDRAFEMYLFPWMTTTKALYWRAANSENGGKDFKPGTVYYGMPYTQTLSKRTYSPATATSAGYFKDSGKGYSLLQTSKFTSRNYPGSDCSAFVSMAIWGASSSRKGDNTVAIANASYYTTLSSKYANDLRPGDLLNKSGSHVVMFLYYATPDKSQIVVIEQGGGGSDRYSNCVSTTIHDFSYYSSRGYKIRRVASLDQSYMK